MTTRQEKLKNLVDRTVCVDLDGVLAHYEGWKGLNEFGNPLPGALEFMWELKKRGYYIVVATARLSGDACAANDADFKVVARYVHDYLVRWNLPYDEVWVRPGKPLAIAYVDDRAVVCRPQSNRDAFREALIEIAALDGTHKAG